MAGEAEEDETEALVRDALEEAWAWPVWLGSALLVIGVVAWIAGVDEAGKYPLFRRHAREITLVGGWLVAMGVAYRLTRRPALAYAQAILWLVLLLAALGAAVSTAGRNRTEEFVIEHPLVGVGGFIVWVTVAGAPLWVVWHRSRRPEGSA